MKAQVLITIFKEVSAGYETIMKALPEGDPDIKWYADWIAKLREAIQKAEAARAKVKEDEKAAKTSADWAKIRQAHGAVADFLLGFYAQQSERERDVISSNAGINEYARPDVGQGFTISTGGEHFKGESTWNFHWAGVILKSANGADSVTLENYAVGDASVQNTDWVFQMYGHREKAQTFHQQHQALRQHGKMPTTMVVENVAAEPPAAEPPAAEGGVEKDPGSA
jgi:hypothetical protein